MTAATFDMFDFIAELVESGIPEKQANAYAKAHNKVQRSHDEKLIETVIEKVKHDYKLDDVATKRDIKELELQIALVKKDIEIVKSDLQRDISDAKTDLTRTILTVGVGVGLTQLVAIFLLFMRMTGKA